MTNEEIVLAVVDAIDAAKVPYMLVGSFSSNLYGIPRSTRDADFVIQLQGRSVTDVVGRLGADFHLDPQMCFETVTVTTKFIIRHENSEFEIELFNLSDDDHDQERFRRKRQEEWQGRKVWVPSPEDVIITKLRWSLQGRRTKDTEDARNVLAVQQGRLDWDYLRLWCGRHGTLELLESIQQSIPPL